MGNNCETGEKNSNSFLRHFIIFNSKLVIGNTYILETSSFVIEGTWCLNKDSVCLSVCLFVCLSFCLFVCLSVCLSVVFPFSYKIED